MPDTDHQARRRRQRRRPRQRARARAREPGTDHTPPGRSTRTRTTCLVGL